MHRAVNHGKVAHRLHVFRVIPQHGMRLRRGALVVPHAEIRKRKVVARISKFRRKRQRMLERFDRRLVLILLQKGAPLLRKVISPVFL